MAKEPYRWAISNQKKMITYYKQHEFLYNVRHEDYKRKGLREKHLEQLAQMLGCTVADIQSKFRNLRTYFCKELGKVWESRESGSGDVYQSKWEFFDDLQFLRKCYQPRKHDRLVADDDDVASPSEVDGNENGLEQTEDASGELEMLLDIDDCSEEGLVAAEEECTTEETAQPRPKEPIMTVVKSVSSSYGTDDSTASGAKRPASGSPAAPLKKRGTSTVQGPPSSDVYILPRPAAPVVPKCPDEGATRDSDYYFAMQVMAELRDIEPVRKGVLKVQLLEMILQAKHNVTIARVAPVPIQRPTQWGSEG